MGDEVQDVKQDPHRPVSREGLGYVERRALEDAPVRHDQVRVCTGCGLEKNVQAWCGKCACMTCTSCCRQCPARSDRND